MRWMANVITGLVVWLVKTVRADAEAEDTGPETDDNDEDGTDDDDVRDDDRDDADDERDDDDYDDYPEEVISPPN